jgi:RecB family exonuclease
MARGMNAFPGIGITLMVGPANSGKMGRVLEWWQERLAWRPVVVVPTGPDAWELSAEMAQRVGGLVGQSPAVTFDGLVRLLLGRSPRYAGDFERTLLVSRLFQSTRTDSLRRAGHLPGLATSLSMLLLQLSESGKTPEEIDAILARWARGEPEAAPLAGDIRRLATAYTAASGRLGRTDRPTVLREAIRVAQGWDRPVAFYGFTSFTPGQRGLVAELSGHAAILVAFTYDRGRGINLCTPEELAWWEERSAELVEMTPRVEAYSSPAIAYLERLFMADEPRPAAPPAPAGAQDVRFLLASGRRAEAELAAQQIAELLRTGRRPGDIGVVVRQVRTWRTLLADVLDSCGIPYQMDDRCVLAETGLGHAFLNALRGVVLDDPKSLLGYLRSPYSGVAGEDVSDLEVRYLKGTARGARVLAEMAKRGCGDALAPLWALVRPDTGGHIDQGSVPGGSTLDLAEARVQTQRMLVAGARGATAGSREIEKDARAFRALQAAFAIMAGLALKEDALVGFEPLTALRLLAQVAVPAAHAETADAVQVLSVHRARARRFAVVIVLGLVEGEFPARPDSPSLLSAAQRMRLDALGGGLFAPEIDQERALFVSAVSRARQLLFLSARDAEDDGSEAAPSHFWQSAKALLGADACGHEGRTLADQVFAPHLAPSLRHYLRACAAHGLAPHPANADVPSPVSAGGSPAPSPTLSPVVARAWRRVPERLSAPEVLDELAAADRFSPSAIETYARCPFVWFMNWVVKIEEVDLELDDRMIGELVHSALSATYRKLASSGLLPISQDNVGVAEQLASAEIEDLVEGDRCPGNPAQRRIAAWRLNRMVRNLLDMEIGTGSTLVASETETEVGGPQGIDIGGVRIQGRIDRVDTAPGGKELFVLDYKSGGIPKASKIGTEDGLQLPLYLLALAAERPDDRVVGGAYLSLRDRERSGVVVAGSEGVLGSGAKACRALDDAGREELFRATREIAQRAADGMRAGMIGPRTEGACPPWCELGTACRARRGGYRP